MRVTGKAAQPEPQRPEPPKTVLIPSIALNLTPAETRLLVELLEADTIIPLRKVMARVAELQDLDLDNVDATRERVDLARGARKVIRFLDDVLCDDVPAAYRAMVQAVTGATETTDGGEDAAGHGDHDQPGHDEPGPG